MSDDPSDPRISLSPWTEDEVNSLNEYQHSGLFHPFTGVNENAPSGEDDVLIATEEGWASSFTPSYQQTWAWKWMANWSWKEMFKRD